MVCDNREIVSFAGLKIFGDVCYVGQVEKRSVRTRDKVGHSPQILVMLRLSIDPSPKLLPKEVIMLDSPLNIERPELA
jgi:hypothetical protein